MQREQVAGHVTPALCKLLHSILTTTSGGWGFLLPIVQGRDCGPRGGLKELSHIARTHVFFDFCSSLRGDVSVRVIGTWGKADVLPGSDTCLSPRAGPGHLTPTCAHTPPWALVQVQSQAHYRSGVGPKVSPTPH